jgi:signal transduction histidine kinase
MNPTYFKVKLAACFLLAITLLPSLTKGQTAWDLKPVDVAAIKTAVVIKDSVLWYVATKDSDDPQQILSYPFDTTHPNLKKPSLIDQTIHLKFRLHNSHDTTIRAYFHPGYYYKEISVYTYNKNSNKLDGIAGGKTLNVNNGFRQIEVKGRETKDVYVKLRMLKTSNFLNPRLTAESFLPSLLNNFKYGDRDINIFTFIFCGILLMMIFYSLAVYAMNRNLEFLYYSGYAFTMAFMFFLKSYFFRTPTGFNAFFESYLDFVIHSVGIYIYIAFLRKFIDARNNFPLLNQLFTIDQVVIVVSLVLYTYFHYFLDSYVAQYFLENFTKLVWTLFTVAFIIYAIYAKRKLLYFLATGHTFLLVFGLMSMYLILTNDNFPRLPPIFSSSMFYYEVGLAIELIFFLIALAFKNRRDLIERIEERERLKLKTERQELEKQMAILSATQDERNRISADMHDELGSGVTAIRLMSEIVKSKMKENTLPEIERISNSANDLINKMNTIIWTMKSENDSLESLVAYIRSYACEFLENTNIDCVVLIPDRIPNVILSGEKRRNIFLCVKESLNNVVKHSRASKVVINFEFDEQIRIVISDNGQGIDKQKLREFGNGLTNMRKRMQGIDGDFQIENKNGTTSVLSVPV